MNNALDFFVDVSKAFAARYQRPLWDKYNFLEDSLEAISLFLEGYAFERQGRNPAYPHVATEVVKEVKNYFQTEDFPKIVWNRFSKYFGNKGLNLRVNPLYHEEGSCFCIWCNMCSENILLYSKNAIAESRLNEAWNRIKTIRGVGSKISSFFLRDIAVYFELTVTEDRFRLQPIDTWVRRTINLLASKNMTDEEVARYVVDNCSKPEHANQGIWYFGSQVAGSEFRLRKSLSDLQYAKSIFDQHISSLKAVVEQVESK